MEASYSLVDDDEDTYPATEGPDVEISDQASEVSVRVGSEAEDFDDQTSEISLEAARPCRLSALILIRTEELLANAEETRQETERAQARAAAFHRRPRDKDFHFEDWRNRALARLHFANERYFLEYILYNRALHSIQFNDLQSDCIRRHRAARDELTRAYGSALLAHEVDLLNKRKFDELADKVDKTL